MTDVEIMDEYILKVQREDKEPLVGLRLSINDKPCLNTGEQNRRNNNGMFLDYPFLLSKAEGCKLEQDMTAVLLDEVSELQAFSANDMDEVMSRDLFLYKDFIKQSNNTMGLYSVSSFGFSEVSVRVEDFGILIL